MTMMVRTSDRLGTGKAALQMPDQNLRKAFVDPAAPGLQARKGIWLLRAALLLFPLSLTAMLVWAYVGWFTVAGSMT
ncbi:MAG: hypothetical protein ACRCS3_15245, partial [Paracoccaceae bacterium]